ncbi:LacI family DNA-binding transcriptional regulator [Saccharothrix syringae]|uniref:LacI family transcriptional regulator n=1 Tax=Saccharothrix syringae TaxID=103733 RepID=A0A5Q0H0T9_SACSY|nr:LacI family DNA-binding transcriptional regulator [Saccharothrix syringae]QFZ19798.1 LacI family transcriptional regulator [Saccharothrix syringae]
MTGRRGSGKPTIADVAALAGVSVAAVSKVVNGKGGISAPTRDRVLRAAARLRWTPSAAAVALRGARTRAVGLVVRRPPDLLSADPHFTRLITGVEAELSPAGHGLLLHLVGDDPAAEEAAYRRLADERRVDGFLLTESRVDDTRFALLRELGAHAVLVGTPWRDDPVPSARAGGDREAGVRAAVEHLLDLGHRRVAYVSGPEDRVHTHHRRRAFEEALAARGLAPARTLVSDFTAAGAVDAVRALLGADDRPTAVLLANDTMAVAALSAARRLGVDVPGELSVVGHDDLPLAELVYPTLTTVRQDLVNLGRAAARLLLVALGEADDAPVAVRPPELVVRESTAGVRRAAAAGSR